MLKDAADLIISKRELIGRNRFLTRAPPLRAFSEHHESFVGQVVRNSQRNQASCMRRLIEDQEYL